MEYEKDCSLTDEVVPVDFTICMNEQAVISVSDTLKVQIERIQRWKWQEYVYL